MSAPALDSESSQSSSGYEDGLGRRVLAFDRETGDMLERLVLRPELSAFEGALRERLTIVAGLEDERFTRPRDIERGTDDRLTVVSDIVVGRRLSDVLDAAAEHGIIAGLDAGLGVLLELLPALARLHDAGLAHGALAPGRVMVTPSGQLVLVDAIYAEALERLKLSRRRLWSEFRLAFPTSAGGAHFDKPADLGHAAMVAAALSVGRPLRDDDYPDGIPALRQEILEIASIRGSNTFAEAVDTFFGLTLPLTGRHGKGIASADEAASDLRRLVRKELGITTCRTALLEFFQQVEAADAERLVADAAPQSHRARPATDPMAAQQASNAARLEVERTEAERLARDRAEAERRAEEEAQARAEEARADAERAEQARVEAERLENERLEREHAEMARLEAEQRERERLEAERLEQELAEEARLEAERLEQERLEEERAGKARLEKARLEKERLEKERAEKARVEAERLEKERLEKERAEKARLEKERLEKERAEKARLEKERLEKERLEKERAEKARLEKERLERERLEKERLEKERAEKARLEKERLEKERLEKERAEKARLEKERAEKARLEKERLEKERLEKERAEKARLEAERVEKERLEKERAEKARLEKEGLEKERAEKARLEKERLEKERLEKERAEKARLDKERAEKARLEAERLERERIENERRERVARERAEKARLELERAEKARLQAERLERERAEAEQRERELLEAARGERDRAEKARLEAERLEQERAEHARLEAEREEQEELRERAERARVEAERLEAERRELEREREVALAREQAVQREHEQTLAREQTLQREREQDLAREQALQREREQEERPQHQAEPERRERPAPAAAAASSWLIPPDRAAKFEPMAPDEPQAAAPTATTRAYPIYQPPAEPASWIANVPTLDVPMLEVEPMAGPTSGPGSFLGSGAPHSGSSGTIRLKDEPIGFSPSAWARAESRHEPDSMSAEGAYEPFGSHETTRSVPWKLIAAGVVLIAGTFAVFRGYAPASTPLMETVRKVAPAVAPDPVPPPASGTDGRVTIATQPPGAKVTLDGKAVGLTPLTLETVSPGRHVITVTGTSGAAAKRTIRVETGKTVAIDLPLFSGFALISAPFVIDVSENGKALGTSTEQILLTPGRHDLRLANKELGYVASETVEIQPGEVTRVSVDPRGRANINAAPWAEVWIDGEKAGDTPLANVAIRLGVREIVFKNPQFGERKVTATIVANAPATISVDFKK